MRKQRKVRRESFKRREHDVFWSPRVDRDGKVGIVTEMGPTHWYAFVDDIAEGTVVLQIASWPKLDRGGRLRFDEIYEQPYPLDALQQVVNRERARHGQPAADRPLRTGDAFSIRCQDRPGENVISPEFEGSVLDITAAARGQAKMAMYGAVARTLKPAEASDRLRTSGEPDRFQRIVEARGRLRPHSPEATATPEV
jgi:hypothetical protein